MSRYNITDSWIKLIELEEILSSDKELSLSPDNIKAINKCRAFLDEKVASATELIYGVNTGFGSLCDTAISKEDLSKLQRNLVISHACGMGDRVPNHLVKRILLLKILGLSKGILECNS